MNGYFFIDKMEISIKNFRSIQSLEQKFEQGNTLICGDSGAGKTTMFTALIWCIYGGKKVQSVQHYITPKPPSVKIVTDVFTCERNGSRVELNIKGTPRLITEQADVDLYFGSFLLFKCKNYIPQGMQYPFADSDISKLLDEIVFTNDDTIPAKMAVKVNDRTLKLKNTKNETEKKVAIAENTYNIKLEAHNKNVQNVLRTMDVTLETFETLSATTEEELNNLRKAAVLTKSIEDEIISSNRSISTLEKWIKIVPEDVSAEILKTKDIINSAKSYLKYIELNNIYIVKKECYDSFVEEVNNVTKDEYNNFLAIDSAVLDDMVKNASAIKKIEEVIDKCFIEINTLKLQLKDEPADQSQNISELSSAIGNLKAYLNYEKTRYTLKQIIHELTAIETKKQKIEDTKSLLMTNKIPLDQAKKMFDMHLENIKEYNVLEKAYNKAKVVNAERNNSNQKMKLSYEKETEKYNSALSEYEKDVMLKNEYEKLYSEYQANYTQQSEYKLKIENLEKYKKKHALCKTKRDSLHKLTSTIDTRVFKCPSCSVMIECVCGEYKVTDKTENTLSELELLKIEAENVAVKNELAEIETEMYVMDKEIKKLEKYLQNNSVDINTVYVSPKNQSKNLKEPVKPKEPVYYELEKEDKPERPISVYDELDYDIVSNMDTSVLDKNIAELTEYKNKIDIDYIDKPFRLDLTVMEQELDVLKKKQYMRDNIINSNREILKLISDKENQLPAKPEISYKEISEKIELIQYAKKKELEIKKEAEVINKIKTELDSLNPDQPISTDIEALTKKLNYLVEVNTAREAIIEANMKYKAEIDKIKSSMPVTPSKTYSVLLKNISNIEYSIEKNKSFKEALAEIQNHEKELLDITRLKNQQETEIHEHVELGKKIGLVATSYRTETILSIENAINDILHTIQAAFSVSLSEGSLKILFNGQTLPDCSTLSGGEKTRLYMAIMCALQIKTGSRVPFVIFDETFASLDSNNLKNCIEFISTQINSVVLVAGHPLINDGLFDQIVNI